MTIFTYKQVRDKILKDLDMQDEAFVDPDEMVGYCNDGIEEAQEEIMKLHEDYFLTSKFLSLVTDKDQYKLPNNIYANKIRGIVFQNGSTIYPVKRLKRPFIFEEIAMTQELGKSDDYRYQIINDSDTKSFRIEIIPTLRETSNTIFKIWYIREASRIPLIADGSLTETEDALVDIPQFHGFVEYFMKERTLFKEGGPRWEDANGKLEQRRKSMVDTLTEKVLDDDNTIEEDFSSYWEHS